MPCQLPCAATASRIPPPAPPPPHAPARLACVHTPAHLASILNAACVAVEYQIRKVLMKAESLR